MNISWIYAGPKSDWSGPSFILDAPNIFTVQLSYDPDFSEDNTKIIKSMTTQKDGQTFAKLSGLSTPLWQRRLYARVLTRADDEKYNSAWSASSKQWDTVQQCTESEFLETRETPNEPLGWYCKACPNGASCLAKTPWFGVKPLFGYARCLSNESLFSQCLFPGACLGGLNRAMVGKSTLNGTDMATVESPEGCLSPMYKNGSRLCSACSANYSRKGLSGECHSCPEPELNTTIAILGIIGGLIGLVVFVFITITDDGKFDATDGIKTIGLSYIQLVSMLVTFPIAWPGIFVAVFEVGGAVSAFGKHLVNIKCMYPLQTEAEVFYSMAITTALLPIFVSAASALCWVLILRCPICVMIRNRQTQKRKEASEKELGATDAADAADAAVQIQKANVDPLLPRIRATVTALLFLIWPNLCTSTFSMFACQSICDGEGVFLRADFEEKCWTQGGRHTTMAWAIGIPCLIVYVIGLPAAALLGVWHTHKRARLRNVPVATLKGHHTWAPFYIAYKKDKWWWEIVRFKKF